MTTIGPSPVGADPLDVVPRGEWERSVRPIAEIGGASPAADGQRVLEISKGMHARRW